MLQPKWSTLKTVRNSDFLEILASYLLIFYYKIQYVCVSVWLSVCPFGTGSQTMRTTVMELLQVTQ